MEKKISCRGRFLTGIGLLSVGVITLILRRYLYVGILSLILILLSLCYLFLTLIRCKAKPKTYRGILTAFHIIFSLVLVSFLITEGFVISAALSANRRDAALPEGVDTVLVAGAGLNGNRPSLLYRLRLDRAKALADANPDCRIVICGGQGDDEVQSESVVGKAYLTEKGLSSERVFTEEESLDTAENIRNFTLLYPEETEIALVTNDFHAYRCGLLAERYGLRAVLYTSPTPKLNLVLNYFAREYISLIIARIEAWGITLDTANSHLTFTNPINFK